MLSKAIALAVAAHGSQLDLAGELYILHPIRVMLALHNEVERVVGVLHDVVEDTPITLVEIRESFGDTVADAVDAISRRRGETYAAYLIRVRANPVARLVKVVDARDNLNRVLALAPELRERMAYKYDRVITLLLWIGDAGDAGRVTS